MPPKFEIKQPKLLLVEGADAYYFFIWACQAFGVNDVQVMDFGGVKDLTSYLKTLSMLPGYEDVTTLVIARDAENDPLSAIDSVKNSLKKASLAVPRHPFRFAGQAPKVAFMILPGFETNDTGKQAPIPGTLEDLCWHIVKDSSIFECVELYVQCLQNKGSQITRLHKTKLHSYLSGKNNFVGLKIGEASKAGAWDWTHDRLQIFKAIITDM